MKYIVPDEVGLYVLLFLFRKYAFFNPPDRLPPFKLDQDFIGIDDFHQVEEDVSLDGVSGEVERLVDLDERTRHRIWNIMLIYGESCMDDHISNKFVGSFLMLH
jgi:hypothetical protein